MTTFETLCRICSNPGEYDFFGIIPVYLHGNQNEFLNWQKPINEMVEETTGLKSSRSDGLPHNCCALCISYLKHAQFFRQQTIKNALSLKAISVLRNGDKATLADKNSLLITEQDLEHSNERQVDTNLLANQEHKHVEKELLNNKLPPAAPSAEEVERQMQYLNLLFDKAPTQRRARPLPDNNYYGQQVQNCGGPPGLVDVFGHEDIPTVYTSSSDEEQSNDEKSSKHNIFSYNERQFQEDDIMDEEELRAIVNVPGEEGFKERKCRACANRFMFDQTYQEHMATCIENQFLTFIENVNRLLYIRQRKAISPHEFIRRMIFSLRKLCDWLKQSKCDDINLPNLNEMGERRPQENTPAPDWHTERPPCRTNAEARQTLSERIIEAILRAQLQENVQQLAKKAVATSRFKSLLATAKAVPLSEATQTPRTPPFVGQPADGAAKLQCTPITPLNNILYEIERSHSRSSFSTDTTVRSIDEFTAAPRMPTTNISSAPVMKPIAVLARKPNDGDAAPHTKQNSGMSFMDKLMMAANEGGCQPESPTMVADQQQPKHKPRQAPKSHIELEQELLRQHRERTEREALGRQEQLEAERARNEQEKLQQQSLQAKGTPKVQLQRPLTRKELQKEILRQNQLQIQEQQRQQELQKQKQQRQRERQLEQQQLQRELEQRQQQRQQQIFEKFHEFRSTPPQITTNITAHSTLSPDSHMNMLSLSCHNALKVKAPSPGGAAAVTAQCKCGMHFETLTALELHNAQHHNATAMRAPLPTLSAEAHEREMQRIIAMFEPDCI